MAKLRVPSLQHLARNWHDQPTRIQKDLVRLVRNPPIFSYAPLYSAVRDLLIFNVPYDQVVKGIERGVKRENIRKILLSVLPHIRDYFDGVSPDFVQAIGKRYYPVRRELMVPFEPPLIYGLGGKLHFPWFSFWRSDPMSKDRLSLFVTLVEEVLLQDPDLEEADFKILDFSAPATDAPRVLTVVNASEVPRVSPRRKIEMLEIFAEGYFGALQELSEADSLHEEAQPEIRPNPDQMNLFDRDN